MKNMQKTLLLWVMMLLTLGVTAQTNDETVTPPEGLTTEEYALNGQSFNYGTFEAVVKPLFIGFDQNDVYVQGLNEYLPQAWVKGTRDGNTITFAKGQYFGTQESGGVEYAMYFGGTTEAWSQDIDGTDTWTLTDVVMTFDESAGTMTTDTWLLVNSEKENVSPWQAFAQCIISKVPDVAATPATPQIANFLAYTVDNGYAGVALDIPTVSTDGQPLMVSKLSYKLYKDIEKDIQPITFYAADHLYIEEDMTEVPYMFTDDYDIEYGGYAAYFYQETADFNRIGVQSIYRGGGEERVSEISWYDIKPYAGEGTVFDFNAMDLSKAHDILSDETIKEDLVTLTISPCDGGNTPNRFYKDYNLNKLQLRMYGGSLTFDVPGGNVIEKIYFDYGSWNEYNEFSVGDFDGNVWIGSTDHLVVDFYNGGGTGNTKINRITLVVKAASELKTVQLRPATPQQYFDLQGRSVQHPTKGLYIVNGKKVVVR